MAELSRVGEVIEASTTDFTAQCYELYQSPPLGSLVKTADHPLELYGIVYYATTASLEAGRRPIARGRDEATEAAIYREHPQLLKLLRTEFSALLVGHKTEDRLYHYLPPRPAPRCLPTASISSTKMMHGELRLACSNRSRTLAAPTPTNISTNSLPLIE